MFSHARVWAAIDALAEMKKMSVSRLARTAGLDPTTFNKSKRHSPDGRLRWPSTESLSKIMDATNTNIDTFTALINGQNPSRVDALKELVGKAAAPAAYTLPPSVPLLGLAEAGAGGYFDDGGFPSGQGWDEVSIPQPDGEAFYALEISGDSMLPLYRDGDRIIVSPSEKVRKGDRVVVKTMDGEVMAKVLARKTARTIELDSLNPDHPKRMFDMNEIEWVARIVWASQ